MKKILTALITVLFCTAPSCAQDVGLSADYNAALNRAEPLGGNGGILVVSAFNDLIVQVTTGNSGGEMIRKEINREGNYEYIVPISVKENNEAHFIFTRRGKTLKVEFSEKRLRADYLYGYRISAVDNPIRLNYQPSSTDMYPSKTEALVEISTAIEKLNISIPHSMPFKISSGKQENDNSINVYNIVVPVAEIENLKKKCSDVKLKFDALDKELIESGNSDDVRWDLLDEMEAQIKEMETTIESVQQIYITAPKSNTLSIDISQMGARSKMVIAVVPLTQVETVQVSECSGFLEEGGRLFELREYEAARNAFNSALKAKDAPDGFKTSIMTSIAQCDTCILYEKYALAAISNMKKMMKTGGSQKELVEYALAGIEIIQVLNRYNPITFYSDQITKLEDIIKEQPLQLGLTLTKLIDGVEAGCLQNVEVWLFYGNQPSELSVYRNEKKFRNLVTEANDYKLVGVTNKDGKVDLEIERDNMPKGLILHPSDKKIKAIYYDINDLLRQSKGTYNKRRFNIKMYSLF